MMSIVVTIPFSLPSSLTRTRWIPALSTRTSLPARSFAVVPLSRSERATGRRRGGLDDPCVAEGRDGSALLAQFHIRTRYEIAQTHLVDARRVGELAPAGPRLSLPAAGPDRGREPPYLFRD